jgi:hypothetical protein
MAGFVNIPFFMEQVWSIREEEVCYAPAVSFHVIWMVQVKRSHFVEKVFTGIACDLTKPIVHIDETSMGIDLRRAAGGILKERPETLLAFAKRHLIRGALLRQVLLTEQEPRNDE